MIRIGLSGKMCSGKSLIAAYLVKSYGFTECSFAARVKELAAELLDVRDKGDRGRYLLQQLANHMREIDPNIWVRYLVNRLPVDRPVVVSDIRYPNECDELERRGFIIIRMQQDRAEQERLIQENYLGLPLMLLDDLSETALDSRVFKYKINNGTNVPLTAVYAQADAIMGKLLLEHMR